MNAPWDVHQSLLTLASSLVEARISIPLDDPNWPWPEPSLITLPFLLRLSASEPEILDYITTPTLEEIALQVEGNDLDYQRALSSLLQRSSCPMRRLCLDSRPAFLQAFSCIVELVVVIRHEQGEREINTLMSTLTVFDTPVQVAPHLRSMFLGWEHDPYGGWPFRVVNYAIFLEMIRSR